MIHYQLFSRFALNQGTPKAAVYFFPAVSRSLPLLSLRSSARSRVHGGGSIAATPPTALLTKNSVKTPFLFRCWGVFDCLARKTKQSKTFRIRNLNDNAGISSRKEREKNTTNLAFIPHFQSVVPSSVPVRHCCCFYGFLFFSFFFSKMMFNFLNQQHYAKFHHQNPPKRHGLQRKPNLYPQQRGELR